MTVFTFLQAVITPWPYAKIQGVVNLYWKTIKFCMTVLLSSSNQKRIWLCDQFLSHHFCMRCAYKTLTKITFYTVFISNSIYFCAKVITLGFAILWMANSNLKWFISLKLNIFESHLLFLRADSKYVCRYLLKIPSLSRWTG